MSESNFLSKGSFGPSNMLSILTKDKSSLKLCFLRTLSYNSMIGTTADAVYDSNKCSFNNRLTVYLCDSTIVPVCEKLMGRACHALQNCLFE